MRKPAPLAILAGLYLAQGLPYGLITQTLPVVLREQGASLAVVGASGLVALPWALKFLWAPLVDRVYLPRLGRRLSWIVPLSLLSAIALALLGVLGPRALVALMLLATALNLFSATQDIATDGLAVESIRPEQRGLANGIQVGGYRVGMVLGGGLCLMLIDDWGWRPSLFLLASLLVVASAPALWLGERDRAIPQAKPRESARSATPSDPAQPSLGMLWLLLLGVYKFGDALSSGMLRPMLVDRGLSMAEIGSIVGVWGFGAGLAGALAGGLALRRGTRSGWILGFGITQAAGVFCMAALALRPEAGLLVVGIASGVEHFTGGLATVALFTVMMDRCRPAHEGSDYTKQACAVVIATGLAATLSGLLAEAVGYPSHFGLAGGVSLIGALVVWAALNGEQVSGP